DGAAGPVGPQGATGPIGPDGLQGDIGPQGIPGIQGPAGADGADGADSTVPGPKGDTGDIGPAGPAGADGADGAVGPAGADGADGTNGTDGLDSTVAGPQGLKGDTGDTGPTGPAGATTMTGLTDTTLSNVQNYNFLQWTGSTWANSYASIRHLIDVDSVGPLSTGDVLVWNQNANEFEFRAHQTITSLSINANVLKYTDEDGAETNIDLSTYLDDTNLARISGGTLNASTGVATFTRDDASTFTLDLSDLLNITLSDISVGTPATASGNGDLSYDNTTGVFTYTPPIIPSDISDLTDNSNAIPSDISDLTDTTSVIPTDFSDLTDNNNTLAGTIATTDLDMNGKRVLFANIYNNEVDLPSATTYHGMFAHVHGTGKGYYAHAGSWIPLATESQVANITFNDINSKPTTIAGYGITDAVEDFADLGTTPTTLAGYGITDVVPTELSDLTDVSIVSPSDGQIMLWNATNNRFEVGEIGSAITTFEKGIYEVATNKSHALNTNVSGDAAANSGGTVIFDTSINGNLFHYYNNQLNSPSWTANITNLPTTNYQFTNVTIIIKQRPWGNTSTVGSLPTVYKLDGQTHTIRWADGVAPSATADGVDVIQLTIMPIETSDGTGVPIYNTIHILGSHTSHPY
ncbi:collagen-like protein, partial [bacterium]|nr:collagen-like protein [bacterium]